MLTIWTIQWPTVPAPDGGTMAPYLQWVGAEPSFTDDFIQSIKTCDALWGQSTMHVLNPTPGL